MPLRILYFVLPFFITLSLEAKEDYKPLGLKLPTTNMGLIDGKPENFYMYVDRYDVNGKQTRPWTGGTFGYCRTIRNTPDGKVATKFHEGIDISPLKRDKNQEPLDVVHSIADGVVVYTMSNAGGSSYGKYIVVKHDWGYGPFYSLYSHMASVDCKIGQKVKAEAPLGRMGYTGVGLNRRRAHLHLELCIMMHPEFVHWHKHHFPGSKINHGPYNGINLCGIDLGALFLAINENPDLDIPTFLKNTPIQYKVVIPRRGPLPICENYPWIKRGDHTSKSPSWEISFTDGAFPLEVAPSSKKVNGPTITWVRKLNFDQSYRTRRLLTGNSKTARFTSLGSRHIQLVSGTFPRKP